MAPNANHHSPGRVRRALHWLFPSRRRTIETLAVEVAALPLALPLVLHAAVGAVAHLVIGHFRWRR
jgi:hypothetical protein